VARQKTHAATQKKTGRSKSRPSLSLTKALGLIILIEGLALGYKFYDDRQRSLTAKQTETHREALALAERVSGRLATVEQTLRLSYQAGWTPQQTSRAHPNLESVVSLADALTAKEETRLRLAGETASQLLAKGNLAGQTPRGDMIVVFDPDSSSPRFGMVQATDWLPEPSGQREFTLIQGRADGAQVTARGFVSACSPLTASDLAICVRSVFPTVSRSEIFNLMLYGMLLLAPAFAILGLFRMFERRRIESESFEGEATRAGRILKTVLNQSKAGFWSWNTKTNQISISAEAANLLGSKGAVDLSVDEFMRFVHDDHEDTMKQSLRTLQDRGFVSQEFANKDKSIWLDMRAKPDEHSGAINGVLQDITATKVAMARTRQAENRLRTALEGFSGPVALWDMRKRLIYWNRAFVRVFGLESTVRSGMGYDTVMLSQATNIVDRRPSEEGDRAEIVKIQDGTWFKIVERSTKNGSMITVGLDVSVDVRNEVELTRQQARLRKLVAELERSETKAADLTKHLRLEKQRAERSANSKNAFLANMSHELRTPLNAINGFSEILVGELYGPLGDDRYKDYAQDILDSGKHLLDLITDILDMAKIEAGKMTVDLNPIDIVDPVDAAIRMIRRKAEEKNISLKLAANSNLPLVEADHRAIRQMILNLVSNAIKFTDEGGEIRVSVDQKDNDIRVAVRDNGIGIPPDALPRLGEPFEQVNDTRDRNYDGTGLGLALTKSFAEMHGGRLTIASEQGRGTQVSFYLPIPTQDAGSASSAA